MGLLGFDSKDNGFVSMQADALEALNTSIASTTATVEIKQEITRMILLLFIRFPLLLNYNILLLFLATLFENNAQTRKRLLTIDKNTKWVYNIL